MAELVDTASRVELNCGCGAGWRISGLLASSDLSGTISNWLAAGHDHNHGLDEQTFKADAVAEAMDEKAEREAVLRETDDE